MADVQGAAGEEVVEHEGEEDADREEQVEAGELDQVRHRDVAHRRRQEQPGCHLFGNLGTYKVHTGCISVIRGTQVHMCYLVT